MCALSSLGSTVYAMAEEHNNFINGNYLEEKECLLKLSDLSGQWEYHGSEHGIRNNMDNNPAVGFIHMTHKHTAENDHSNGMNLAHNNTVSVKCRLENEVTTLKLTLNKNLKLRVFAGFDFFSIYSLITQN